MESNSQLQMRWAGVQSQIAQRAVARSPAAPAQLIAVSKTRPVAEIAELLQAGQRDFGENYVQEATAKITQLRHADPAPVWHLIGHLQSNKAEHAAQLFDWIHTVDRSKLLAPLSRGRLARGGEPLNVLIQVNIDDDDAKHGCAPADVPALAEAILATPGLRWRGLMTIGRQHEQPDDARATFRQMKALFDSLQTQYPQIDTLSMGMSGDYLQAIDEGATLLRVGSAIFGARPLKDSP